MTPTNPYEPPSALPNHDTDDDVQALATTPTAKIASTAGVGAGVVAAVIGLQGVLMFRGIAARYMLVMLVLGVTLVAGAMRLRRMHTSGALVVIAASLAMLAANVVWCFFSTFAFLVMPMQLVQEMLSVVAVALALVSLGATRRAGAVRAKGIGF